MRLPFLPAFVASGICAVLLAANGYGQVVAPPDSKPPLLLPDAATTDSSAGSRDAENPPEPEPLTRGPLHEAFAEQIDPNPQGGGLEVGKQPPADIDEIPPESCGFPAIGAGTMKAKTTSGSVALGASPRPTGTGRLVTGTTPARSTSGFPATGRWPAARRKRCNWQTRFR